jgi:hypothetical protein
MRTRASTLVEQVWRQHFVAYEDALASFELSFRVDPKSIPRFVKLTTPIRIKFPFAESTCTALCRLVRFRMISDQFVFRFATVDPI